VPTDLDSCGDRAQLRAFHNPILPSPSEVPHGPDSLIPLFVLLDFIYGIVLVYLYAAIRPRFGAGPGTAVHAGLIMWVIAGLLHAIGEAPFGLLPQRLYTIGTLAALIAFPIATVAGARFYREA
jgi:hypothetical protein